MLDEREFAEIFQGGGNIELYVCRSCCIAGAKMNSLGWRINRCLPCISVFSYPSIATSITAALTFVSGLIMVSCNTQVSVSIVERVVVSMICLSWVPFLESQYLAMHQNGVLFLCSNCYVSHSPEAIRTGAPTRVPFKLRQFIVAIPTHLRNLPLRQWNFAVGFKEWERHAGIASCVVRAGCTTTRRSHYNQVQGELP